MSAQTGHFYEFGAYRIEKTERLLMRGIEAVPLPPKAVEVLLALLESSGHVVTKEELMQRVWADAFVEEVNLPRNIFLLRKALDDGREGEKFIETIPRRGYRFIAPVAETREEGASLVARERTTSRIVVEEEIETDDSPYKSEGAPAPAVAASKPKHHWRAGLLTASAAGAILMVGVAVWYYQSSSRSRAALPPQPPQPFQAMRMERISDSGKVISPALSPDGQMLAYVLNDENQHSIWMKNINTGSKVKIMSGTETEIGALMFSRDGDHLFYRAYEGGRGVAYQMPVFGGGSRKVIENVQSHFDFSPDGKKMTFVRKTSDLLADALVICDIDGRNERQLKTRSGHFHYHGWGVAPAWSPDGKIIVAAASERKKEEEQYFVAVQVSDGSERVLQSPKWHAVYRVSWLADGTGMIVLAQEKPSSPYQIWHLTYPGGEAKRITNDLHRYGWMSLSADSQLLAVTQETRHANISVATAADPTNARQVTSGLTSLDGYYGLAWTPDGKVVYASGEAARSNLWISEADGSNQRQITFDEEAGNVSPSVTLDGRRVVFLSNRTGVRQIWTMNLDGSDLRQLTDGEGEVAACLTPDGRWLLHTRQTPESHWSSLWKTPLDGQGPAVKLSDIIFSAGLTVSPDGRMIAFGFYDQEEKAKSPWKIGVISIEGGERLHVFAVDALRIIAHWAPDSRALYYMKNARSFTNLWLHPLRGGPPRQVTNFKTEHLANFAWSPDGKHLAFARGSFRSDAFLVSNFK